MGSPSPPKTRSDFDVALICALPFEADTAEALFDHSWDKGSDRYGKAAGDRNTYRTGLIGNHNVVLVCMPGIGKTYAATVAANLRTSFPSIRLGLIVGVCGGVPNGNSKGIFLGDVIISDEIVTYDLGRRYPDGFHRKEEGIIEPGLRMELRTFLQKLSSPNGYEGLIQRTKYHEMILQSRRASCRPPVNEDRLFQADYHHSHRETSRCKRCKKKRHCSIAKKATCDEIQCDRKRVARARPSSRGVNIHFGRIASGDTVMKSGLERDNIAAEEKVIAFEMESAGVCQTIPCIVIKGVCDYADSHKDKVWQSYAAGTAAACMKSVLEQWATINQSGVQIEWDDETLIEPPQQLQPSFGAAKFSSPTLDEGYNTQSPQTGSDNGNETPVEVSSAVKSSFKKAFGRFRHYRKYLPRSSDFKHVLKTQYRIYLSAVEILKSDALESVNGNLNSSQENCWQAALAIKQKLEQVAYHTKHLPLDSMPGMQFKSATNSLKECMEDLTSLVHVFVSSVSAGAQPCPLKNVRGNGDLEEVRQFEQFQILQQAARSLYQALSAACSEHSSHNVHLCLQPSLRISVWQARFDVALLHECSSPGQQLWMNVESTIKAVHKGRHEIHEMSSSTTFKRTQQTAEAPVSTRSRKRVRLQHLPENVDPAESIFTNEPVTLVPNLHLQRNLCTLVTRASDRVWHQKGSQSCIGLLGDYESCKHLAYFDEETTATTATNPSTSLAGLILLSGASPVGSAMSVYQRIQLARVLASAVLYYHATPWLKKRLRSTDISFLGVPESLLQKAPHAPSYIATSVHVLGSLPQSQQHSESYQIVRNPAIFGLGIILLELAYQSPLEELQEPADIARAQSSPEFIEYFTAHRLLAPSHRMVSRSFKSIITKCLYCDFGHDSDFASPALQQAFYRDVVGGLVKLEETFQELQLDD